MMNPSGIGHVEFRNLLERLKELAGGSRHREPHGAQTASRTLPGSSIQMPEIRSSSSTDAGVTTPLTSRLEEATAPQHLPASGSRGPGQATRPGTPGWPLESEPSEEPPIREETAFCLTCHTPLPAPVQTRWPGAAYCEACLRTEEALERQAALRRALDLSRIPRAYQGYRLDRRVQAYADEAPRDFIARVRGLEHTLGECLYNRKVIATVDDWLVASEPRPWLWLTGPRGTGKTLLLACLGQRLLEDGLDVCFYSEQELFSRLTAAWQQGTSSAVFQRAEQCEVLLLDDCNPAAHQADPPRPWMVRAMMGLINGRYNGQRTTLFTSPERLLEYGACWRFGSAPGADSGVAGRIFERCGGEELELADLDWRTGWVADVET